MPMANPRPRRVAKTPGSRGSKWKKMHFYLDHACHAMLRKLAKIDRRSQQVTLRLLIEAEWKRREEAAANG